MTVLSNKTEALLALGIAATVGCDSCIEHHVQDALDTGATKEEVQHTIDLARRIGGKPSMTCCDEAMESLSHGEEVPS